MSGFRRRDTSAVTETKVEAKVAAPKAKASSGGGKTYHNDVMTIFRKDNGELFLTLDNKNSEGLEIMVNGKKLANIYSNDFIAGLEESVDKGKITEEKANEIADKLQNIKTKDGDTLALVTKITLVTE